MNDIRPTPGRMIHYRHGEGSNACMPGIVCAVYDNGQGELVNIVYWDSLASAYKGLGIACDMSGATRGTWHWPERA
jgi:hypothetical protein